MAGQDPGNSVGRARKWDRLTNGELIAAYDAFRQAREAMLGICNQPRTGDAGADAIEKEDRRMAHLCDEIVTVLRRRGPQGNHYEIERWAETIVSWLIIEGAGDHAGLIALAKETCAKAA